MKLCASLLLSVAMLIELYVDSYNDFTKSRLERNTSRTTMIFRLINSLLTRKNTSTLRHFCAFSRVFHGFLR